MSADFASSFFNYEAAAREEVAPQPVLLAGRPPSDWAKLLEHTEMRRFSAGERIISAGETDRSLYLLTEGALGVRLNDRSDENFSTIEAPSVVGEIAFIDGGPRSATLVALSDGELLRLRMESYESLAAREPELGRAIVFDLARIVTARLRATNLLARGGA